MKVIIRVPTEGAKTGDKLPYINGARQNGICTIVSVDGRKVVAKTGENILTGTQPECGGPVIASDGQEG